MANDILPATCTRPIFDVASDLESTQDALRIINDIILDLSCELSHDDDKSDVLRISERITVLTNCARAKLQAFDALVQDVYEHHKAGRLLAE